MDVVYTKPSSYRRKLSKTRPALSTPIKLSAAGVGLGVSLGTGLSDVRDPGRPGRVGLTLSAISSAVAPISHHCPSVTLDGQDGRVDKN